MNNTTRAALVVALGACGGSEPLVVPGGLQSVWVTEDAEYADRAFEITAETVVFQTGPDSYAQYPIISLDVTSGGGRTEYGLGYGGDGGGEMSFDFFVEGGASGQDGLRFSNQQGMLWQQDPARATPWRGRS